jgi:maltoporin
MTIGPPPSSGRLFSAGLPAAAAAIFFLVHAPFTLFAADLLRGQGVLTTSGYFRAGIGASEGGATQAKFIAPGAQSKYRLGNEPDTNIEIELDFRWYTEAAGRRGESAPYSEFVFMIDSYAEHGNSDALEMDRVAKAYIVFANMIGKGIDVWAGRRRYYRKDIHLNDHFWLNPGQGSQAGAGIEDIRFGPGTLKIALFRFEDTGVKGLPSFETETGLLNSEILDLRLTDIPLTQDGALTLWGQLARREENENLGFETQDGYALGLWHRKEGLFGGDSRNRFAVTFRQGAAMVQGTFNGRPVRENFSTGYALSDSYALEINNDLLYETGGPFSVQWGVVLREDNRGVTPAGGAGDTVSWYSTGLRPVFYLTDHLSLAWETGVDYVENEPLAVDGYLLKSTLALQVAQSRGYFSRPVLRVFFTGAWWSDAFAGLVGSAPGDAPYGDEDHGWTLGAQVETWW